MVSKRGHASVFAAVQQLDSEDVHAARKRQATEKDLRRSRAARSQTKIHGLLMELRILFQRFNGEDAVPGESKESSKLCNELLSKLLKARSTLNSANSDVPDYSKPGEDIIATEYRAARQRWMEVLNRRHKDLRLHAGITAKAQFKIVDSTFWEQVEATVAHEQMRAGESKEFDDSKLYQHMLQDFLVAKGASAHETTTLERRKSKSRNKKNVDRKASKGRKIRYVVVPKLVNFTFPVSRPVSDGMDGDEWFKSLFGADKSFR